MSTRRWIGKEYVNKIRSNQERITYTLLAHEKNSRNAIICSHLTYASTLRNTITFILRSRV